MDKLIEFSNHARQIMVERGTAKEEIEDTIRTSPWLPARLGRLECEKVFPFATSWRGKFYRNKRVRPVFIELPTKILVITVYTYYF
jgi:hypothetical protein